MAARTDLSGLERAAIVVVSVYVMGLVVWPIARLIVEAVAPRGALDLTIAAAVLDRPATWRAAWHSFETSAVGAIGAVVLGGAFAVLVALTDVRARLGLVFCFLLPMTVPPAVIALAWGTLFGPASPLLNAVGAAPSPGSDNPMYSPGGIMWLLAVTHAPLAFLVLRAGLKALPRELVEAARLSGAGGGRVIGTIVIPILWPSVAAALALAFVSCLGNFGIPAILGISERYFVLPTLIYVRLAATGPAILSEVAVLSIIVALIGVAALALQLVATRRARMRLAARPGAPLALALGRWRPAIEVAAWTYMALILVLPLVSLVTTSLLPAYGVPFGPATATLDNYAEVLFRQAATIRAFWNSLWLSLAAAAITAALALPLAYFVVWKESRFAAVLSGAAEVPYALPGVVLAIALILVFLRPLPVIEVELYGTVWILLVAYLARFFVLALKPAVAGFQQLDPRLDEAARVAGAGFGFRVRTILLPILLPAALAGGILVFLTAFNELTVSALLWSVRTETIGVVIFNLEDSGQPTLAAAISVVSIGVMLAALGVLQAMARRLPAGVLPWSDAR